jgi:LPPG:FO 2-phospho-L-lactate transferase
MIVVLSGGTGGAKFLQGLQQVVPQNELTVIINTGDDLMWWGLHISPDVDSVLYGLAGLLSRERGWGVNDESFHCLETMRKLRMPAWFQLGDRDLAVHLTRTELLCAGRTLTEATQEIASKLGVHATLLPMSDDRVETRVLTAIGELSFQQYFVREHHELEPLWVNFVGAEGARPASGVLEAIAAAQAVILAPSNPITSIGPILAVPGIRDALRSTAAPIAAVSPIIAGAAVSGPAGALMRCAGVEVSVRGVAQSYADFLDVLIADNCDRTEALQHAPGVRTEFCYTIMASDEMKRTLAKEVLEAVNIVSRTPAINNRVSFQAQAAAKKVRA